MSGKNVQTLNQKKFDLVGFLLEYNSYMILIALIIVSAILSPYFFTKNNLCNLARQYSVYFLLTIGILFVIFTGSIDLSLGSSIGFGGILFGICLEYWGWNVWGAGGFLAALLVAAGYYFCIASQATAVSFDTIALILNKHNARFEIATTMMVINIVVLLSGAATYSISAVLCGLIFTFLQAQFLKVFLRFGGVQQVGA